MRMAVNVQQGMEWLEQFNKWLSDIALQYGYIGIFFISFIGASSVIIPVPYTLIIFYVGSLQVLDPFLIAVSGGAGSAIGEFVGYFLGYYGRAIVSEERQKKLNYILKLFSRYGAVTIFLFALTPLPDDLLFIPLGIMRYSFIKAFVPCLLGKTLMCFILAYGGHMSISFIETILGGEGGALTMIASTVLLVIVIVAMFKIDWEKLFPLEEKPKKNRTSKSKEDAE
jgi:membrane protein YqaA with SNARE-associated domain